MFYVFLNGIFTGLLLQIAIGPVFFYILNLSIQRTLIDGFFAVIAVTLADFFFIGLAIMGVGKLLENNRTKVVLGLLSSFVLIIFGIVMIVSSSKNSNLNTIITASTQNYLSSFLSSFFLTISSPLTIVFWTGLFTTKAIEKNYSRDLLIIFGFSAGLATLIFLGTAVVVFSLFKNSISSSVVQILNIVVGTLLIAYAIVRFVKMYKSLSHLQNYNE